MDLLLDTCAFIWWDSDGDKLSTAASQAMRDPANRLRLSQRLDLGNATQAPERQIAASQTAS